MDKHDCPSEICIWFLGVNISTKYFYFPQIAIYILKIHLSTWNLDYMIPKEISHTSVQNPTMNFKKEILVPFRKLLVPFRTTKDCHSCRSLLLVWQICSLNWDLYMNSFVGTLCISIGGPVAKYLLVVQEVLSSNPVCYVYYFFMLTSLVA